MGAPNTKKLTKLTFKLGSKAFVTFCLPFGGQNYLTELHI